MKKIKVGIWGLGRAGNSMHVVRVTELVKKGTRFAAKKVKG